MYSFLYFSLMLHFHTEKIRQKFCDLQDYHKNTSFPYTFSLNAWCVDQQREIDAVQRVLLTKLFILIVEFK